MIGKKSYFHAYVFGSAWGIKGNVLMVIAFNQSGDNQWSATFLASLYPQSQRMVARLPWGRAVPEHGSLCGSRRPSWHGGRGSSPLSGSADGVTPFSEYTETGDMAILVREQIFCPDRVLIPTWGIYFHRVTDSQISFHQCLHFLCPLWLFPAVTGTSVPHEAALPSVGASDAGNRFHWAKVCPFVAFTPGSWASPRDSINPAWSSLLHVNAPGCWVTAWVFPLGGLPVLWRTRYQAPGDLGWQSLVSPQS